MLRAAWNFAEDWLDWLSAFVGVVYDVFMQVRPCPAHNAAIRDLSLHFSPVSYQSSNLAA